MTAWRSALLVAACVTFTSVAYAQDPHAGHTQGARGKDVPAQTPSTQPASQKTEVQQQPTKSPTDKTAAVATEDHSAHTPQSPPAQDVPKEPIPPLTDAHRAAAFPPALGGHTVHDKPITTFILFDQLEWQGTGGGPSFENDSWIGGDLHRVWIRAEGDSEGGRLETAQAHVLYGRSFSRWWDVVVGARQDFRPGPAQTWMAFGIQGLAPYWFEVEATGYVGQDWRTHARFEVEYELLFTNRLILQPLLEVEIYGKADPERRIGAGLSSAETGLRLRYEFRREFAPYVGVTWDRKLFGTSDRAEAAGEETSSVRFALGVRAWF